LFLEFLDSEAAEKAEHALALFSDRGNMDTEKEKIVVSYIEGRNERTNIEEMRYSPSHAAVGAI